MPVEHHTAGVITVYIKVTGMCLRSPLSYVVSVLLPHGVIVLLLITTWWRLRDPRLKVTQLAVGCLVQLNYLLGMIQARIRGVGRAVGARALIQESAVSCLVLLIDYKLSRIVIGGDPLHLMLNLVAQIDHHSATPFI